MNRTEDLRGYWERHYAALYEAWASGDGVSVFWLMRIAEDMGEVLAG